MCKILQFLDKFSWDHKSSVSPFSLYGGYEYKGCVANHLLGSEGLKNSYTLLKTFYSFFCIYMFSGLYFVENRIQRGEIV